MTRFAWAIVTYVSALFTTGLVFFHPQKNFIWNASASAPIGLYRIEPVEQLDVTDLAVVMPPNELASFLEQRGYLPKGVPLLKRVLALSGTKVCRHGKAVSAYDMVYGEALDRDSRGRPLPVWQGCITIEKGQAFFMNWDVPDSFDGRYFGALPLSTVIGRAIPLWTYDDPPISRSFNPGKAKTMTQIGTFTRKEDGFFGRIRTLTLDIEVTILPAEDQTPENAPNHRVFASGQEVGAAWDRTGERAGSYLSVAIDDPSFVEPIRARMFESDTKKDVWNLHWTRKTRRDEQG